MAFPLERYPPASLSRLMPDPLTLYIQLGLLIRRLAGKRMKRAPDERRDALMTRLEKEQDRLGRWVWN